MSTSFKSIVSDLSTVVLVLCAVVVTALVARRELRPARETAARTAPNIPQPDWLSYAAEGRHVGPVGAPVALIEFADFECPACLVLHQRIVETRRRLSAQFAVVYRHFPLAIHPFAQAAAEASECAAAQGRFEQMHDVLFRQQATFGPTAWRSMAGAAGVADLRAFDRCMDEASGAERVRRDFMVADRLKMTGTPTVFINGMRFAGAIPQDLLDSLVRETLRRGR